MKVDPDRVEAMHLMAEILAMLLFLAVIFLGAMAVYGWHQIGLAILYYVSGEQLLPARGSPEWLQDQYFGVAWGIVAMFVVSWIINLGANHKHYLRFIKEKIS